MFEPDGRPTVAIVTNAREFAGPAAVTALAAAGARVYCHDRSFASEVSRVAFASEHDQGFVVVLSETEPEDVVAAVVKTEGRLDALVSNDVHPARRAPVSEVRAPDFRDALEDMMVFPMRLAAAAAPVMTKRKAGRMLFVTSAVAETGLPNYAMYAAARGGANALAVSLAAELGPAGVSVNALAPNFVENPTYFPPELLKDKKLRDKIAREVPLRRTGTSGETGALIAFLAGPDCGFLTGQVIPLTGGWR